MSEMYEILIEHVRKLWKDNDLFEERVHVKARVLSPEEAIGNPESDDFPLQKGKERLMQAEFKGSLGQAFTDHFGDFEGTLDEVADMAMENNYRRAVFVASLNAVQRHIGKVEKTIHCRDEEPKQCARELTGYIAQRYGQIRVTQVGFQPRMVESIAPAFPLRVLDLDPDNIGRKRFQVTIEGPDATEDAVRWADLLLVTGTTLVNGTVDHFLGRKPILFYGTTIAGAARLMGWERFCAYGG